MSPPAQSKQANKQTAKQAATLPEVECWNGIEEEDITIPEADANVIAQAVATGGKIDVCRLAEAYVGAFNSPVGAEEIAAERKRGRQVPGLLRYADVSFVP